MEQCPRRSRCLPKVTQLDHRDRKEIISNSSTTLVSSLPRQQVPQPILLPLYRMAPDLGALYQDLLVPQEAWLSSPPLVLDCQEHVTIPNFILSCPPLADTRETGSCLLKGPQGITTYIYPSPDCNTLSWLHPVFTISLSNLKTAPKSDGVLVSSITPEGQEPWGPHSIDDSSRAGTPYTYSGRVFPAFLFPF
jgi:hypothetical protein